MTIGSTTPPKITSTVNRDHQRDFAERAIAVSEDSFVSGRVYTISLKEPCRITVLSPASSTAGDPHNVSPFETLSQIGCPVKNDVIMSPLFASRTYR